MEEIKCYRCLNFYEENPEHANYCNELRQRMETEKDMIVLSSKCGSAYKPISKEKEAHL